MSARPTPPARPASDRSGEAALRALAATVAGEMRAPLLGLGSAAQLLRFRAREDPVLERNAGRVLRELERLNRIAAALAELARPVELHLAPHDPEEAWDAALAHARGRLESGGTAVHRARAASAGPMPLDVEQLAHAFTQLLTELTEGIPHGSRLAIASSDAAPEGSWMCHVDVTMAPDEREDAHHTPAPTLGGLAVLVARRIVEAHGGSLATQPDRPGCAITLPRR